MPLKRLKTLNYDLLKSCVKKNQRGFTLIELVIGLVIGLIVLAIGMLIYIYFLDVWNQGFSFLELQREGSFAMEEMAKEIREGSSLVIDQHQAGDPVDTGIRVTVNTTDKVVKFYHDTDNDYLIKDDNGTLITIVPGITLETNINRWIGKLLFTNLDPSGSDPSYIRIDLELRCQKGEYNDAVFFTSTVQMRNK